VENLAHAVSLHCNVARPYQSLRELSRTPVMAAGVTDHVWSLDFLGYFSVHG